MVEAVEGNGVKGGSAHVYVFIGITLIVSMTILIGSLAGFILWGRRAWRNLKESGVYDALRNPDGVEEEDEA